MKNIIKKIKKALVWTFSREVLDAINSGASYEEVEALVQSMTEKKGSADKARKAGYTACDKCCWDYLHE